MFEIEYKGGNAVVIATKKSKIVVDPRLSLLGLKDINVKDAIELATEERFALNDPEAQLVIDGPGEFGIAEFDIKGIAVQRHIDAENEGKKSIIYRIEVGDSKIGVIGNIIGKLSDEQLEELGVLDVLIIPVGGNGYTLDSTDAVKMVRKIDPRIVIPVHYADTSLKYEVPQQEISAFISELSAPVEQTNKFKMKQASIDEAVISVIQLDRN